MSSATTASRPRSPGRRRAHRHLARRQLRGGLGARRRRRRRADRARPVGDRPCGRGPTASATSRMETMYEYGSRVRLLAAAATSSTSSTSRARSIVCAVALERNRKAAREIRGRGHESCCARLALGGRRRCSTREQEREHIRLAVESITETTGERPLGWYCRYGPSVNTRELVVEEGGFLYDSDAYNDDLPYWTMVGGKKHLVDPLLAWSTTIRASPQGHFGAPRLLRGAPALHVRPALQGGRDASRR